MALPYEVIAAEYQSTPLLREEAENTEQKAERPPARVANFQQLYRRRSFAPERLIISSVLDASSSSSASRYNEDRAR